MFLKIFFNYSIIMICIAGFAGGGVLLLFLPVIQLVLSCYNYQNGKSWQTVFMLQFHLLLATALGIYSEGYLYLRYISNDAESVLVLREIWKIETAFVCGVGIQTTLFKYFFSKKEKD